MAFLHDEEVDWMGSSQGMLLPPDETHKFDTPGEEAFEVITQNILPVSIPTMPPELAAFNKSLVNYTLDNGHTVITNTITKRCYTEETSLHDYDGFYMTFTTILTGILCVIGLVGNIFALLILLKDQKKNLITVLLAALCAVDWFLLLYLLIAVVVPGACLHWRDCECVASLMPALPYVWPWSALAQMVMIWIIVMASFSRYAAVCHPFKFRNFTKAKVGVRIIVIIVLLCFIFQLPRIVITYLSQGSASTMKVETFQSCDALQAESSESEGRCYIIQTSKTSLTSYKNSLNSDFSSGQNGNSLPPLDRNIWYRNIYLIGLTWLCMYIVPLVMLFYMNIRLSIELRRALKMHMRMTNKHKTDNIIQDHSMTMNIIAIITVFLICQTPDFISVVITHYPNLGISVDTKRYFIAVSIFLQAVHSAIDFLIYFTFYSRFRSEAQRLLCPCATDVSWTPRRRGSSRTDSSLLSRSSGSWKKSSQTKRLSQAQNRSATSDAEEPGAASKLLPQGNVQMDGTLV